MDLKNKTLNQKYQLIYPFMITAVVFSCRRYVMHRQTVILPCNRAVLQLLRRSLLPKNVFERKYSNNYLNEKKSSFLLWLYNFFTQKILNNDGLYKR